MTQEQAQAAYDSAIERYLEAKATARAAAIASCKPGAP